MNVELKECVTDCLRSVIDPETGADVVRMRLVQDLEADDEGLVRYTFRPSSPLCPLAVTLALQIKQAITHQELGTWQSVWWQECIQHVLTDKETRLVYD